MLKRTKIVSLLEADQPIEKVLVKGWVRTRRDAKDFSFIELNDGSSLKNIQIIANNNLSNYEEVKKITTGSSLAVTGALVESKGGNQKYEIVAGEIEIYSLAPDDFPLQKKKHTDEYLRTIAHLRPRTNNTVRLSVFVRNCLLPYTNFLTTAVSAMSIRRLSPVRTARVPAKCFRSPLWI